MLNSKDTPSKKMMFGQILSFAIPIMATNILQLTFNSIDMAIVGRFSGHEGLAAVGSTTSTIFLFLNILIGISIGINVVIAQLLGAQRPNDEISRAFHTSIVMAIVGGVITAIIGISASELFLEIVNSPEDIRPLAMTYLRIYFLGTPFQMIYNYSAAALRATKDTKRPLIFLSISGIMNVILNCILVIFFELGTAGVAIATVFSHAVSAALSLRYLSRIEGGLQFSWKKLTFDKSYFRKFLRIGIPAGIQGSLYSIADISIQSSINTYSSATIAGSSISTNIEGFVLLTMNAFPQAAQTFVAQSVGEGNYGKIKKIMYTCFICVVAVEVVETAFIFAFDSQIVELYNGKIDVVEQAIRRMRIMLTFYWMYGVSDVIMGALRGYGKVMSSVIINLVTICGIRLLCMELIDTSTVDVVWVYYAFPFSWIFLIGSLIVFSLIFIKKEKERIGIRRARLYTKDEN